MEKILIVDDEKEIADLLQLYLKNDNYDTRVCYNGSEALKLIDNEEFDLAILDVMLPEIDGMQLCAHIREKYYYPIIMLTAKNMDADKILGLTLGADDYITKPFNALEVMARVKTALRRYNKYNNYVKDNNILEIRGLKIDKVSHECFLYEEKLNLTPIEFDIILYLMENQGKVVDSEVLFEKVWKEKYFDSNNTIMTHIARIREKMHETPRHPKYIETIWGVGYVIK